MDDVRCKRDDGRWMMEDVLHFSLPPTLSSFLQRVTRILTNSSQSEQDQGTDP